MVHESVSTLLLIDKYPAPSQEVSRHFRFSVGILWQQELMCLLTPLAPSGVSPPRIGKVRRRVSCPEKDGRRTALLEAAECPCVSWTL